VHIEALHSRHAVIVQLSAEHQQELATAEGTEYIAYPLHDGIEYLAGFINGRPVACGAVQPFGDGVGEIKRMYVRPTYRGNGYGRLILAALEELALQRGFHTLRLEAGRNHAAALGLYRAAGYHPIPRYGDYVSNPLSLCFEKSLLSVEV
jgi:GNAT superfamily N-acetyltransferase